MAAGSSQALVSELKDALVRFPQNRHTLVIQRVIELFIDHGGHARRTSRAASVRIEHQYPRQLQIHLQRPQ